MSSVPESETKYLKSEFTTDTPNNGGKVSAAAFVPGTSGNVFPVVTKLARLAGLFRYRKTFFAIQSTTVTPGRWVKTRWDFSTPAADRWVIGKGTQTDMQSDIEASPPVWTGTGELAAALAGGETEVTAVMEHNSIEFIPGGYIYLSDKYHSTQTIGAGVEVGNSVTNSEAAYGDMDSGTWTKIPGEADQVYPKGIYAGNDVVLSFTPVTKEEFQLIADTEHLAESIGTGDATTTPSLSSLTNAGRGLMVHSDYQPIVKTVCSSVAQEVLITADGTCTGYCSAGQLNMADGTWTTSIVWTTAPDTAEDITIDYTEKPYSYVGNTATIFLANQVLAAYATPANARVCGCITTEEVATGFSSFVVTSSAGTYDSVTYPILVDYIGGVYDVFTLTFTSTSAFTCSGLYSGAVGTGNITANFSPNNPLASAPYFTLNKDGFGGTYAIGDTLVFVALPAVQPTWTKQTVDAGTPPADNGNYLRTDWE